MSITHRVIYCLLSCLTALGFTGCNRDGAANNAPVASVNIIPTDPHAIAQLELEKVSLDLQRFVAVRIQDGERRLEASPLSPAIVADARLGNESFKTIFRVNSQGDTLIMFSRDVFNGRSYRTEIPLAELARLGVFTFPVVQPDGSLKARDFKLVQIVKPE